MQITEHRGLVARAEWEPSLADRDFYPKPEDVLQVLRGKGYRLYERDPGYDLNIVGIRTVGVRPSRFDDFITVFYRQHGEWFFNVFPATTDPNAYWLRKPDMVQGNLVLAEGEYLGSHRLGRHRKCRKALLQKAPMKVVHEPRRRDGLDLPQGRAKDEVCGIHIHGAYWYRGRILVDAWCTGCQVICDPHQYGMFLRLCEARRKAFGNSFSYVLLSEADFL